MLSSNILDKQRKMLINETTFKSFKIKKWEEKKELVDNLDDIYCKPYNDEKIIPNCNPFSNIEVNSVWHIANASEI